MKREDLKKLGLTDEVIEKAGLEADLPDKIMALHGKDIEKHKEDLATATTAVEGLQKQLDEANKQIESFKELKPEELQKAVEDWKTKAETAEAEAKKQIDALKFDHALDGALLGAKAKNLKAVKALLKIDDLKLSDDGSIVGLAEQLEKVKTENDYLFDSDEPDPKIVVGGKNKTVIGDASVMAAREAAGLPIEKDK
jgi:dsDNA-specific endonuclease/ATPase MutS2